MGVRRQVDLRGLAERIRAIEERHEPVAHRYIDPPAGDRVPTGWAEVDAALGGGLLAGLHEWFGVEEVGREEGRPTPRSADGRWSPPLCILVHLAWQAQSREASPPWTVWIGRRCHPYPRVLIRGGGKDRRLLTRSLFVAPREAAARLWAIDLALRSPAVGCVVADGSGFDRAATQRIQLLARTQGKTVLAACPAPQRTELSAAQTRWGIRNAECGMRNEERSDAPRHSAFRIPTSALVPRWSVELLRCKGMRPTQDHPGAPGWLLEWNRAEGAVHLSARLADPAGAAERPIRRAALGRPRQRTA
ncbi:MAG TPA: hypothetical protein VJZ71_03675 [Phycisphaerae bacterium]|nr:hypothetical protein [Phycisphaerae bacterium]